MYSFIVLTSTPRTDIQRSHGLSSDIKRRRLSLELETHDPSETSTVSLSMGYEDSVDFLSLVFSICFNFLLYYIILFIV